MYGGSCRAGRQAGGSTNCGVGCMRLPRRSKKVKPHPFLIANRMVRNSYVSCQSALAFYGLIPEYVPVITSVTTARPARWETPFGVLEFRHIKTDLLRGYRLSEVSAGQQAFVATPEKALLDLVYLHPGGDSPEYLRELRLQNVERLNLDELQRQADLVSLKLRRAVKIGSELVRAEVQEYETL
ncbi:hypothetical protein HKBW3S09_01289 [Candidatus Hakubella thermalkaliphila]|uniref:AbiEi antitoxin C-terminal domain-containing protein n=1 Tax=Candidatus Hakubella thermalkaliphila TaxID=2754717 RepID=A0A6V8NWH0_9ACTN|nr:hypothetical protein HKBW3S09_01289 [Candidatus Hakubella thermalkaliphila]